MVDMLGLKKNQIGIYSICSAHPFVLAAAMARAQQQDFDLYIESTSNQVDQFGGYTGQTPAMFAGYVLDLAGQWKIPKERVILGGDHLGPNVWRNEPSAKAMEKACDLVSAYVKAGYRKIHLDASMHCADDPLDHGKPLESETVAIRTAEMADAAEQSYRESKNESPPPFYVIGSDVPPPGGATDDLSHIQITAADAVEQTIGVTRKAFQARGLEKAWERVIAVVVQPGVEFGDQVVAEYNRDQAKQLSRKIQEFTGFTYEAHSTDYQKRLALREMVEDHFTILKVGPWLTFAFREAVYALELIEREWLVSRNPVNLSNLRQIAEKVMVDNPRYWKNHYTGNESENKFARSFSYSDRIRYYWPEQHMNQALNNLIQNLNRYPPPLSLVSQFLPRQYHAVRDGRIKNRPVDLIYDRIHEIFEIYEFAIHKGRNM